MCNAVVRMYEYVISCIDLAFFLERLCFFFSLAASFFFGKISFPSVSSDHRSCKVNDSGPNFTVVIISIDISTMTG
jgi:hypothetical protein